MMKTYKRWDHAMNDLFAIKGIEKLIKSIDRKHAEARGIIWDFVSASIAAQEQFHNEFLDYCKTRETDPEELINSLWHPLDYFVENRSKVIEAIREGMTRRAFSAGSASGWLLERPSNDKATKQRITTKETDESLTPPEPQEHSRLSHSELADRWRARAIVLEARCERFRAEIRKIKRGIREVVEQNRKLTRQLNAVGKSRARVA